MLLVAIASGDVAVASDFSKVDLLALSLLQEFF